jgi:hypothetical protein
VRLYPDLRSHELTAEQRRQEVASILARGVLRCLKNREDSLANPLDLSSETSPDEAQLVNASETRKEDESWV